MPTIRRPTRILATILALSAGAARAEDFPAWAFPAPIPGPGDEGPATAPKPLRVPGSAVHLTDADLNRFSEVPDWFPGEHPALPEGVGRARDADHWACAYCHLADGTGRPENATLAGLPAAYIRAQIAAFRAGTRRAVRPDWLPSHLMIGIAGEAADTEVAAAAEYFSARRFASRVRVVEAPTIPHPEPLGYVWSLGSGVKEPIGNRIIEVPVAPRDFERRDPHARFVAYVPPGSIAHGRALATNCETCHGAGLRGDPALPGPPLAGHSPTYLFRQLYGFRVGTRTSPEAEPMRVIAEPLSEADMVALAAYAASLSP